MVRFVEGLFLLFAILVFDLLPLSTGSVVASPRDVTRRIGAVLSTNFISAATLISAIITLSSLSLNVPTFTACDFS